MDSDDIARLAGALDGVRSTVREGLAEWRYDGPRWHGCLTTCIW